jgi:hypothetical protein
MNEKITELYVQANKYASEAGFKKYDKAGDVNWQWEDTVFEKFAELIVRECADYTNWYQANSRYTDIAKAIKEHFGVEE